MVDMAIPGSIMASAQSILVRSTPRSVVSTTFLLVHHSHTTWNGNFNVLFCGHFTIFDGVSSTAHPLPMSHSHTGCITGVLPATAMCLHWGDPWGPAHAAGEQGRKEEEEAEDPLCPWDEAIWPRRRCVLIANSTAFCTCVNQSMWMSSSVMVVLITTRLSSSHFMSHASGGDYKLLLLSIMCVHSVSRNCYMMWHKYCLNTHKVPAAYSSQQRNSLLPQMGLKPRLH